MIRDLIFAAAIYWGLVAALIVWGYLAPSNANNMDDNWSPPMTRGDAIGVALFFYFALAVVPIMLGHGVAAEKGAIIDCDVEWDGRFNSSGC